jgi:prephenate dehydrogenase
MSLRQITIIGTGLIGGSLALALRRKKFAGKNIGCDREAILEKEHNCGAIDEGMVEASDAVRGSDLVVLATPVLAIVDLIQRLGPALPRHALLTDVGSTKALVVECAKKVLGKNVGSCFLAGHPMAGKEVSGVEFADADLFHKAVWFVTPLEKQNMQEGLIGEFLGWIDHIGARVAMMPADEHDRLCAWISHVPQMISTALAAALVEEFGEGAPLRPAGGRALQEMTRISASPYSMWRDVAISNKKNLADALWKVEQRLAHIRDNLATRELAQEFDQAHALRKSATPKKARAD